MGAIAEYLQLIDRAIPGIDRPGYHYRSIPDFLIREGQEFTIGKRPSWCKQGIIKMCYSNARKLVKRFPTRVWYAEGYACGIMPVSHVWCIDKATGLVIDPTWEAGTEYHGIFVDTEYLIRHDRDGGGDSIIDDWQNGWPILKDGERAWTVQPTPNLA